MREGGRRHVQRPAGIARRPSIGSGRPIRSRAPATRLAAAARPRCPISVDRVLLLKEAPVAQLDRALPSEGKGRVFESRRARQRNQQHG